MRRAKKRTIELHREQWEWHFHHPTKQKEDWPRWEVNGGNIPNVDNLCFLCEYSFAHHTSCKQCLLKWPHFGCMSKGGPYGAWIRARSPRTRKKYAKLIRDLPEK